MLFERDVRRARTREMKAVPRTRSLVMPRGVHGGEHAAYGLNLPENALSRVTLTSPSRLRTHLPQSFPRRGSGPGVHSAH